MKVYRMHYHDPSLGCQLTWHSSLAGAKASLAALRRAYREEFKESPSGERRTKEELDAVANIEPTGIEAVEIPTDKAGLIGWLNNYVTSDNG